ncbi:MAG: hypothetical protein KME17_01810 [Cyanosarcina radialis HA8281-LM2]|jgi:hypothetical protein|nr:hypothetical protein [Cyanosarcina radialis HA8281-LM2]
MSLSSIEKAGKSDSGFSLPVAMGMGLVILMIGALLIARSMQSQAISIGRSRSSNSLAIAEAGVARTLAQLTEANNAILLSLNYDPINPETNKTFLGSDGVPNNGDEESSTVNQWANPTAGASPCAAATVTGTPSISYSGTVGTDGTYTLLAYRYNSADKTATFVVEGRQTTFANAYVAVTVSLDSTGSDFPGVMSMGDTDYFDLKGRPVLGKNGNVYYNRTWSKNQSLTGSAAPGEANRSQYFNAISTGTDNISGKIVACTFDPGLSYISPSGAEDLGDVNNGGNYGNTSGGIKYYKAKKINLDNNKTLDFNTTNGPVYIYVGDDITLRGTSKIRNVRSDGQPPRVGDLRLILGEQDFEEVFLYDSSCIETAFIYDARSDVHIEGSGDGCPSAGSSNIDGVVWAEDINQLNPGTAGISVPDDLSSLSDVMNSNSRYKIGAVKSWQKIKL